MQVLQPPGWARPRGYSNGVVAKVKRYSSPARSAGTRKASFKPTIWSGQVRQALQNVVAVLAEAGGKPEHIARMNWYITDKQSYISSFRGIGEAYREVMGAHYPAMTAVEVTALIEDRAKVEIEVTAVIPD